MKVFLDLEPQKRQSLLVLFVTGLFFWTSITALLPTLPTYISDVGGTTEQVGWVMGCFAIGLLASRTWLGHLADRRSRQLVVLIGTIVAAIAPLGYLFIDSIPGLMAIRAFHGISIAAFTTGYSALVVDLSPLKQRGELIGYMSLAVPIGMAGGPALGDFLATSAGYAPLFATCASLGFLSSILALQLKDTNCQATVIHHPDRPAPPSRNFGQLLQSPALQIPAVILLLVGLVFGALVAFLPLFIREAEVAVNAGLFYTAAAIASFVVRIMTGRASDRFGRGLFITASLVCYAAAMLLLAGAQTPPAFLFAAILEGAGSGVFIPLTIALISDRSRAPERGQVYALCIGGFDVGIALAGPLLGSLVLPLGYRGMFALAGGLGLIALGIFLTRSNKDLLHSLGFALGQAEDLHALE